MGMLTSLFMRTVAPTEYTRISDELAATVVQEARTSLVNEGNARPTQSELNRRAQQLYLAGAQQFHHSLVQRMDMQKAIDRLCNEGPKSTGAQLDDATVTREHVTLLVARGDHAGALQLLSRLAHQGDHGAELLLGAMYEDGVGVPRDYAEAAKWLRKAAEAGDHCAQFLLGRKYWTGQGVPESPLEALEWYRKAANQGDEAAQKELAAFGIEWKSS